MKILIVDDAADNIFLLKSMLQRAGYEDFWEAASGREAIDLLTREFQKGSGRTPADLIFLDFMMPGMNGLETCKMLKETAVLKDIPIIMVTANHDLDLLEKSFGTGAMDFITKPIRRVELLARTQSALTLKKEQDARKDREHDLENRNRELEKALREVKTLREFIPICASCKKIRNVSGMWQQLESYFKEHQGVRFSHGLCEPCLETEYKKIHTEKDA